MTTGVSPDLSACLSSVSMNARCLRRLHRFRSYAGVGFARDAKGDTELSLAILHPVPTQGPGKDREGGPEVAPESVRISVEREFGL